MDIVFPNIQNFMKKKLVTIDAIFWDTYNLFNFEQF